MAVDFSDQPFVITQPKRVDPFGNPQVDPIAARGRPEVLRGLQRVAERVQQRPHRPRVLDGADQGPHRHDVHPYGPYRMPRPLYEYGLNEFNQNGATAAERHGGGCPTGHTLQRQHGQRRRHALGAPTPAEHPPPVRPRPAPLRRLRRDDRLAGVRRDEVRDQGRHPGRVGHRRTRRSRTGSSTATCRGPRGARARSSGASPRSARARARARSRTRSSTRSACPTTTTTRTSRRITASAPGPWDILDRGSFNGPGGPHKRWLVPVTQGGAMEAGMTLRTKLSEDWFTETDVHRVDALRPGGLRHAGDAGARAHGAGEGG